MANTTNFNWETPDDTDLVKDGAAAIRTLGSAIDTSLVDLKGGTTGQVLSKATGTDMDFTWVAQDDSNAIQNAIIDAKGDLIVGTAADTPARLAVGTNGYVLTADSAQAAGVKWAASAGGGKVLQVVQGTFTGVAQTTSTTMASTGLTVSITPSSATSKVLILASISGVAKTGGNVNTAVKLELVRGATKIMDLSDVNAYNNTTTLQDIGSVAANCLDTPATTSATSYTINFASYQSGQTVYINNYRASDTTVSAIIAMEIGA